MGVSNEKFDTFAQEVLQPEYQRGAATQDKLRQTMLPRLLGDRRSTLRRPRSSASCAIDDLFLGHS